MGRVEGRNPATYADGDSAPSRIDSSPAVAVTVQCQPALDRGGSWRGDVIEWGKENAPMTFPSVTSALDYINRTLTDFYNQSWVLRNRLLKIGRLKQEAKARNDQQALGQLIIIQQQVSDLMNEQLDLENTLRPFADYFGVNTNPQLGLVPAILLAGAAGVAAVLYLHFEKIKNQQKALDLIERGLLPASAAEGMLNAPLFDFSGMGSLGFPILAVVGLMIFLQFKR